MNKKFKNIKFLKINIGNNSTNNRQVRIAQNGNSLTVKELILLTCPTFIYTSWGKINRPMCNWENQIYVGKISTSVTQIKTQVL